MTENSEVVPRGPRPSGTGDQPGAFGTEGTPDVSGYGGLVRTIRTPRPPRPGGCYDQAVDTSLATRQRLPVLPSPKWSSARPADP